jgi:hypothetical protein
VNFNKCVELEEVNLGYEIRMRTEIYILEDIRDKEKILNVRKLL